MALRSWPYVEKRNVGNAWKYFGLHLAVSILNLELFAETRSNRQQGSIAFQLHPVPM
jgi:hypothetical protein